MALHKEFPKSPFSILNPQHRWFPADEALREVSSEKLLPPLVSELRKHVQKWRSNGYADASKTSIALLNWWFNVKHLIPDENGEMIEFRYYFSQREAIETIIYLYDVVRVKDKYDLMRFDSSGILSSGMFDEDWRRFVVKMATGSGKTKVLSMVITWCYFHKLYEEASELARNFLVIAPNIIVLDRLYKDFEGLRIFYNDPLIPENGFDGRVWWDDFQMVLHVQDDVRVTQDAGNIFLSNIHRVYSGNDTPPTSEDENTMEYFLGSAPKGKTTDSKVDLGIIVRDIDELIVLNDEAHHIHDKGLAWHKSIKDIHNQLTQKGKSLALQVDVTATPKHNNGAIFVQTVADYPLVEAITQNVVKRPVLPDASSRAKLAERQSAKFTEKYADFIDLGVIEWRKAYNEHQKMDKKAILFVMTDDTKNCDDVAEYLEGNYPDLKNSVLVIHTKKNGEISEASSGKSKEELEWLRKQANEIDNFESPYKAIVSVLVLKEGWDVRNVTTIVGLRAYSAKSNILPEQTLGRGLRKMYPGDVEEYVSVVGTDAFMDFVESIQAEGVVLERKPMGAGSKPKTPIVVEVDSENKDIDKLDIEIPVLTPRIFREYKRLIDLNLNKFTHKRITYKKYSAEEQREIVFKEITTGKVTHTTVLDTSGIIDYSSVIGHFTQTIMKDLRLVSGYDVLYPLVKEFIKSYLFEKQVDLEDPNTLRNLSEIESSKTILESFKKEINKLTIDDRGDAEIRDSIKLRNTRPFVTKEQGYLVPKKSVFNKIIGDSHFELLFAKFLEDCADVISYAKNYFSVHFQLDYVNADGNISNYYPDFIVKLPGSRVVIVETKGQADLDVPLKMERLKKWCEDINRVQDDVLYDFVYVDQEGFEKYKISSFDELIKTFIEYKN
ncbi:Type III restriction protein res subunit [Waddlia chondrophila 2032/99]|uniref:Type III restriction protein res subunit n=1 Tax=Waddlia chondrophila 2032/99 TaxID=765953 RepID=F8LCA8_9BACT|nr:Type III restriction protein res subunit [Waddlia chondrophila 2032/99]